MPPALYGNSRVEKEDPVGSTPMINSGKQDSTSGLFTITIYFFLNQVQSPWIDLWLSGDSWYIWSNYLL